MVYHYTNFVFETNAWWLRRVRPIWAGALTLWLTGILYRYYFFGKIKSLWNKYIPEEEWIKRAQENKRDWGYNAVYKPTLARSTKKAMLETLGENYRYPEAWPERYMIETKSLEQIMEEEENWE